MHTKDSDCTLGPDDTCKKCSVTHGDPCPRCKGRGFHKASCPTSSNTIDENVRRALLRASGEAAKADELTEQAHMTVYNHAQGLLHVFAANNIALSAKAEKTSKILTKALRELGDAREKLGDAVHQIEKALKTME